MRFCFLLVMLLIEGVVLGQDSFQVSMDSTGFILSDIVPNNDKSVSMLLFKKENSSFFSNSFFLGNYNHNSKKAAGFNFQIPGIGFRLHAIPISSKNKRIFALFNQTLQGNSVLFSFDFSNNTSWSRITEGSFGYTTNTFDQTIFAKTELNTLQNQHFFEVYQLNNLTGSTIKKVGWQIISPNIQDYSVKIAGLKGNHLDNTFYLFGYLLSSQPLESGNFIIIKFNEFGHPEKRISLKHPEFYFSSAESLQFVSPQGKIYLIGKTSIISSQTGNNKDLIIAHFDKELNFIWSKIYSAEKFDFQSAKLNFDLDGELYLAYSTRGAYPTITAKLSKDGDIISENGYSLYSPQIDIATDGSILMQTNINFDSLGRNIPKNIFAKTDIEGNIKGCENYIAKLNTYDASLNFGAFDLDSISIQDLGWINSISEPKDYTFTDFCDLPPPPNPDFNLKDTICVGECISTDSTLGNRNANGREWILEGDNFSLTIEDDFEFAHCFTQPGTYTLRQTIWFLGVDYSYEKIIEVLPPLSVEIVGEEILCDLPPVDLTADANRPLYGYEWSTGDTISSTQINEGGAYWLNANDGYCYARTERNFEFIFEKIDTSLAINLPDSLTACEVLLPYELRPESNYSTVFENENSESNSVFLLSNPGVYEFSTEVDGCRFSKVINFKIDACKAEIFTPSAFSPNDDGINDIFLPFSPGIEPIRLSIYDRWGGKLFESNDSFVGWDGKRNGKISAEGVYVFRLEYVNLLTGLEEEISGDVTLIR